MTSAEERLDSLLGALRGREPQTRLSRARRDDDEPNGGAGGDPGNPGTEPRESARRPEGQVTLGWQSDDGRWSAVTCPTPSGLETVVCADPPPGPVPPPAGLVEFLLRSWGVWGDAGVNVPGSPGTREPVAKPAVERRLTEIERKAAATAASEALVNPPFNTLSLESRRLAASCSSRLQTVSASGAAQLGVLFGALGSAPEAVSGQFSATAVAGWLRTLDTGVRDDLVRIITGGIDGVPGREADWWAEVLDAL